MLRDELKSHFLAAVDNAGLSSHRDALLPYARECVHFFYHEPTGPLPPGSSRVGGLPDLPPSLDWPRGTDDDGNPRGHAEFLAQFNLADIPPAHGFPLPRTGHLWLFVRNTYLTSAPTAILYHPGPFSGWPAGPRASSPPTAPNLPAPEPLSPRPKPKSNDPEPEYGWRDLGTASLTFKLGVSLPLSSKSFLRKFPDLEYGGDAHEQLSEQLAGGLDSYGPREGIDGQLGGYSYQAEVDLTREYAMLELGHGEYAHADHWSSMEELETLIQNGHPFFAKDPEKQKRYADELRPRLPHLKWILDNEPQISALADSLQLLCMFRPNTRIDLEFGDGMYLDFLMHRAALAERDFSKVYCVLPMLL